ncbi:MAG: cell division protein ZipA C-terminal FtsZ-binding domain-containing protein [bacterium]
MTQNLQIILALLGAAVVLAIYLISKRQQGAQSRAAKPADADAGLNENAPRESHGAFGAFAAPAEFASGKVAPRLGGRADAIDDDIPVLDDPIDDDDSACVDDDSVAQQSDADARMDDDRVRMSPESAADYADESRSDSNDARFDAMDESNQTDESSAATARVQSDESTDESTNDSANKLTNDSMNKSANESANNRPADSPAASPSTFHPRTVEGFKQLRQIDYWAKIIGERDVGRETVLAIYRDGAAGLRMPHGIYGLKLPANVWCDLEHEAEDSRFGALMLTIQLADHSGAIAQQDLSRFETLAMRLSVGTGREFSLMTSPDNARAQAEAIAEFIAHFDSVSVVRIRPRDDEHFNGAEIERHAIKIGLDPDRAGHYARFKSVGKGKVAMYRLADASESGQFDLDDMASFSARGLVLFTKPALNRSPGAVFAEMANTAVAFASRIKGTVDLGQGETPTQDDIEAMRKPIDALAAEMERLGIPAGSDEATRIF